MFHLALGRIHYVEFPALSGAGTKTRHGSEAWPRVLDSRGPANEDPTREDSKSKSMHHKNVFASIDEKKKDNDSVDKTAHRK